MGFMLKKIIKWLMNIICLLVKNKIEKVSII